MNNLSSSPRLSKPKKSQMAAQNSKSGFGRYVNDTLPFNSQYSGNTVGSSPNSDAYILPMRLHEKTQSL